MNVAIKNSPFQREVREWQRIDPNTGALMSGRMQADRWQNGHANKYGKVIEEDFYFQYNLTIIHIFLLRSSTPSTFPHQTAPDCSNISKWKFFKLEQFRDPFKSFVPVQFKSPHHELL